MNETREIWVLDCINNDTCKNIPYNFDGTLIVKGDVRCDDLKLKGCLFVDGDCCIYGDLTVEAIYGKARICVYGTMKAQDVVCGDCVVVGSNLYVSGDISCNRLDVSHLSLLGDLECTGSMRVDSMVKVGKSSAGI